MRRTRLATIVVAALTSLAVPGAAQAAGRCGEHPWCDRSKSADARAGLVLAQLTLDEKLDLMGGDVDGLFRPEISSSIVNGIPRLDVPPLNVNDGPGGIRQGLGDTTRPATALPTPLALGASFDIGLAARYARVIAAEAKRRGHDLVLGPTVNLVRDPRGGRTFESYGEDPRLMSDLGVAWIRAMQGAGVIADVKHYAANNQETDRFTVDEIIDERTLREIYLPHFEAAVKRGRVGTVMTAYNKVNGSFMGANRPLIRDTLFESFGFDGFVLSDFYASGDTVGSALAGQSLALPRPLHYEPALLRAAIAEGRLTTATIDDLVRRYLRVLFRFGVFDRAAYPREAKIPVKRHGRVARLVEDRGIVLLRNRGGLLPLNARRIDSVAVIGKSADVYQRPGSISSGGVRPFYAVTALEGLRRAGRGRFTVRHDDGSDRRRAVRLARRADVAVVAAAPDLDSGEFFDRPCIDLDCEPKPPRQDRLIRAVAAANPRTVVVLQSPGPVTMPWVRRVGAVVEAWWPGEEGGNAIADVLLGKVNPSGKLPVTYPRDLSDVPARTEEAVPRRRRARRLLGGRAGRLPLVRPSRHQAAVPVRPRPVLHELPLPRPGGARAARRLSRGPSASAREPAGGQRRPAQGRRGGADLPRPPAARARGGPAAEGAQALPPRRDPERAQPRHHLRARGPRLLVLGRGDRPLARGARLLPHPGGELVARHPAAGRGGPPRSGLRPAVRA